MDKAQHEKLVRQLALAFGDACDRAGCERWEEVYLVLKDIIHVIAAAECTDRRIEAQKN
jgi:hypothetical protein